MSKLLRLPALLLVALLALAFDASAAAAQKALVYCPTDEVETCGNVVAALSSTGAYPEGVDKAYDGSNGTVDLRTADLFAYTLFVVPSLSDDEEGTPLALLRDATVAGRLKLALLGRRAFYSGTPDLGATNRLAKNALIVNLARWAGANFDAVRGPGLVVLQDNSDVEATRYDWVRGLTGLTVTADIALKTYASVRTMTATGMAIMSNGGTQLAYDNMASFGFYFPSGAPGLSLDAVGQTGTSAGGQVVLVTAEGANTGGATVQTDRNDYVPGSMVTITGAGFAPGETIKITLHEDPLVHEDRTLSATADQAGAFVDTTFSPEAHHLGVRFVLTATGQTSARRAQTTFTDGNVQLFVAPTGLDYGYRLLWYDNTTCTGSPAGQYTQEFLLSQNSSWSFEGAAIQFVANATSTNGRPFDKWTAESKDTDITFNQANRSICVPTNTNNTKKVTANFGTAVATSVAVDAATGTYGGTTTLKATLTSGSPATGVNGKTITFRLNGNSVGSATTNVSGVATLTGVSLTGINAGSYAAGTNTGVAASFVGDASYTASSGGATLTVGKADQTITFGALAGKSFGDAAFTVSATASSGLAVSFSVGSTDKCTISGSTVTITGAGSCTVTASQAGNTNYNAAASVPQSFSIAKKAATISLSALNATYDGTAKAAVATTDPAGLAGVAITYDGVTTVPTAAGSYAVVASLTNDNYQATNATGTLVIGKAAPLFSGLTAPAITFGTATATVTGTLKTTGGLVPSGSVTALVTTTGGGAAVSGTGTINASTGAFSITVTNANLLAGSTTGHEVTVSFAENTNFAAASDNSLTLVVNQATQSITFTAPTTAKYGDADAALGATASSGLTVSYASSTTGVCTIVDGKLHVVKAGSCTVTASQAGNTNFLPAPSVERTFSIAKVQATITLTVPTGAAATYTGSPIAATAAVDPAGITGLSVTYAGSTTAPTNAGTYAVVASLVNDNYEAETKSGSLTIGKASQVISWATPAAITYGTTLAGVLNATLTTGDGALSYDKATTDVLPVGAHTLTVTAAETPNYIATSKSVSLTVNKAQGSVSITSTNPGTLAYNATYAVTTSKVGDGGVTLSVGATDACEISNGTVTMKAGVGSCTVTATLAEGGNYLGASTTQTFAAAKATASITLTNLSHTYNGAAKAATATTSPAGLTAVTVRYFQNATEVAAADVKNAGSYVVKATLSNTNYDAPEATETLVIGRAAVTATAGSGTGTYTGSAQTPSACAVTGTYTTGISCANDPATVGPNVGTYTIVPSITGPAASNFDATPVNGSYAITQATSQVVITWENSTYNGSANGATATVKDAGGAAIGGATATLTYYSGSTAAGTALSGAPTAAGTYTVRATFAGNTNYLTSSETKTITIARASQTITFAQPTSPAVFNSSFTVNPTATSPLPVAVSVSGVCEKQQDGSIKMTSGTGNCIITAAQAGNENYEAATAAAGSSLTRTVAAAKAAQTITFPVLADTKYNEAAPALGATATSGLTVTYGASGNCTVSGSTISITGAGSCTVTASQAGDDNYDAATAYAGSALSRTFAIAKATASITLTNLSHTYDGSAKAATATTAPLGLSGVSLVYKQNANVVQAADVKSAGSYTVEATLDNANYQLAALSNPTIATLVINQATQAALTLTGVPATATYNTSFNVTPGGGSGTSQVVVTTEGVCTIAGNTVTMNSGTGTCTVKVNRAGDNNYFPATQVTASATAAKATQTIAGFNLTSFTKKFGDAPFSVAGGVTGGGSGNDVLYSSATPSKCTVTAAGLLTIVEAGSCTVKANQAGNANYEAASEASSDLNIGKATPTVSVSWTGGTFGATSAATGSVSGVGGVNLGTPTFSYEGVSPTVYAASATAPTNAGSYKVTASFAATVNYEAATNTATTTIAKASTTTIVEVPTPPVVYDGTNKVASATVTGAAGLNQGLTVTYQKKDANGAWQVSGTPRDAGDYRASASYAETANYGASQDAKEFSIAKAPQTITFVQPTTPADYNSTFTVSPTTTASNLVVAIAVSGVCETQTGNSVKMTSGTGNCVITASQIGNGNYLAAAPVERTVAARKIAQAALSVTGPTAGTFGEALSMSATGGSSIHTASFTATGTACSIASTGPNAGKLEITSGTGTCALTATKAADDNYSLITSPSQVVTIAKAALNVEPNPKTPDPRQYSDPNPTFAPKYTGFVNGQTDAVLDTKPTCSTTAAAISPEASYPITCSGGADNDYAFSYTAGSLGVTKEDMVLDYTGQTFVSTNRSGGTASAQLSVSVSESQDGNLGSVPWASIPLTVRFSVYTTDPSSAVKCDAPVSASGSGAGTASCSVSGLKEDQYIVQAELLSNAFYRAAVPNAALTAVDPGTGFTTGGGSINDPNTGARSNFGFTARFLKNGGVQGNSLFIYRKSADLGGGRATGTVNGATVSAPSGTRDYNFIIKSNQMSALTQRCSTTTGTEPCWATFTGGSNVKAVDRLTGIEYTLSAGYIGNQQQFQIDLVDNGEPGSTDRFAIKVWTASQTFMQVGTARTDMNGTPPNGTQVQLLGGNVQVRLKP
ncbi:MBG domain-containing protein [Roseisolibacter agri]|uniref:Uncharacterized protein n=1 Tax=Roseisolibacter agri TaxID=2014610 RepID=A0AA37V1F0_9BACT|nr:MBG domain-containing protein [Roseisolibacter agri]GLC23682.1 hypothetical protein rosag_01950 [Roseisolibacter agri]